MKKNRIYFLDNLKSSIIILVVLFHAALAYKVDAPTWWYVLDTKRVFAADIFHVWADVFIMTIMFFISGYFGLKSLEMQTTSVFWKNKWKRIGLPWIFGTFVLAPHVAYIMLASRGVEMPYIDFYLNLFLGVCYQQSQYWYLGALMALYLILAIISHNFPSLFGEAIRKNPSKQFMVFLWGMGAIAIWMVNQIYTDDTWTNYAYILQLQPTRVPMYIIYFFLGAYAYRKQWFLESGYTPRVQTWIPMFIILSIAYVWMKTTLVLEVDGATFMLINAIMHSLFCLCAVFTLLGVYKKFFSGTHPIWATLSTISYPIYYIHQNIVQEMNWFVRPMEANAFVKYSIVCTLSLILCYLVSRYILLFFPPFRIKRGRSSADMDALTNKGIVKGR